MKPILFSIGPFNVYAFGFLLALSFVLSTFLIWKFAREELKEEEYLDAYFYTSFIALISARIVYIVLHIPDFGTNILRYILVRDTPGLSISGGLLGGFLFLYWYAKRHRFNILHLLDLFGMGASLALGLSKIGQFLGGAGFGIATKLPIGVKVVGSSGLHHPLELYYALSFFVLFIILFILYSKSIRRKWPKGLVVSVFAWGTSLSIFLLEFLTVRTVYLSVLSFRQIVAAFGVILFLIPIIQKGLYLKKSHL